VDNRYETKAYSPQGLSEISNPNTEWNMVKQLNCDNCLVDHVTNEFRSYWYGRIGRMRLIFNYTDGTSSSAGDNVTDETAWIGAKTGNPFPFKTVNSIGVQLAGYSSERATKVLSKQTITLEVNLPEIVGTISHTKLVLFGNREQGDSVTYQLGNNVQMGENLPSAIENAITNQSSNPTKMLIKINPSAAGSLSSTLHSWILFYRSSNE
jgi:hypothetical protein